MYLFPHSYSEIKEMLNDIGVKTVDDLFNGIPVINSNSNFLNIKPHTELEIIEYFEEVVLKNKKVKRPNSFLGAGVYRHFLPSVVEHILSRGEFFTSYTPYQPEVSQGTLQSIFEFQTAVAGLFAMDIANASMYDGSTALAEASLMAERIKGKKRILVSEGIHPEYVDVLETYVKNGRGCEIIKLPLNNNGLTEFTNHIDEVSAVIIQSPNFFGCIEDIKKARDYSVRINALLITVCNEVLSLGLLKPPGKFNVDIAVGEGQSFCIPPSFGGPYLGLFTTRKDFLRQMPGRLVGETIDTEGNRGYVLTLSTREQHIKRENATSNICTNSNLNALAFIITLSILGKNGLKRLSLLNLSRAHYARTKITSIKGVELRFPSPFFNEFATRLPIAAESVVSELEKYDVFAGVPASRWFPEERNTLIMSFTEMNSISSIDNFVNLLTKFL